MTEWIEYWRNLIGYLSLSADSWNNKNAFNTSKYWFMKTCAVLKNAWNSVVLTGTVYYDETLLSLRSDQLVRKPDGKKLKGHSQNQMTIGVAIDDVHTIATYLGNGEPTQKVIYDAFVHTAVGEAGFVGRKNQVHRSIGVRAVGT